MHRPDVKPYTASVRLLRIPTALAVLFRFLVVSGTALAREPSHSTVAHAMSERRTERTAGGVSGQDLYRWIETNRPECLPRVIFVTGDSASQSTREFLLATGRRCLLKPFSVEEYVTAIQETLGALRPAA